MAISKRRIVILRPGKWKNIIYNKKAIRRAYQSTNWDRAKYVFSGTERVANCIGELTNIKFYKKSALITAAVNFYSSRDSKSHNKCLWDVCPKVMGDEQNDRLINFKFVLLFRDNISAVGSKKEKARKKKIQQKNKSRR